MKSRSIELAGPVTIVCFTAPPVVLISSVIPAVRLTPATFCSVAVPNARAAIPVPVSHSPPVDAVKVRLAVSAASVADKSLTPTRIAVSLEPDGSKANPPARLANRDSATTIPVPVISVWFPCAAVNPMDTVPPGTVTLSATAPPVRLHRTPSVPVSVTSGTPVTLPVPLPASAYTATGEFPAASPRSTVFQITSPSRAPVTFTPSSAAVPYP